jgi:outer membrane immunogenic protein
MKKLLTLAAAIAISAPLSAYAADLPMAPPPPPRAPAFVPPAPFTWTGFYVGINGGYSWATLIPTTMSATPPRSIPTAA